MSTRSTRPGSDRAVTPLPTITGADSASIPGHATSSPAEDPRTAYPDPVDGLLHTAAARWRTSSASSPCSKTAVLPARD